MKTVRREKGLRCCPGSWLRSTRQPHPTLLVALPAPRGPVYSATGGDPRFHHPSPYLPWLWYICTATAAQILCGRAQRALHSARQLFPAPKGLPAPTMGGQQAGTDSRCHPHRHMSDSPGRAVTGTGSNQCQGTHRQTPGSPPHVSACTGRNGSEPSPGGSSWAGRRSPWGWCAPGQWSLAPDPASDGQRARGRGQE